MKVSIFESRHLSVVAQEAASREVIVCFNDRGTTRAGLKFWGDEFLRRAGYSGVGVVTDQPNWYPPQEMVAAAHAIAKYSAGRPVLTYGFSQGAYGALKYSRLLRARAAVALSPQWSIDPADVSSIDDSLCRYHSRDLENGKAVRRTDVCSNSFAIYDPAEAIDYWHAARLRDVAGVRLVPAPFMWHGTIHLITETHVGRDLLRLRGSPPGLSAEEVRSLLRSARRRSKSYFQIGRSRLLVRHIVAGRPYRPRFLLQFHRACADNYKLFEYLVAFACNRQCDIDALNRLCARDGTLMKLNDFDLLALFMTAYRERNRSLMLLTAHHVQEHWPKFFDGLATISLALQAHGETDLAAAVWRQAASGPVAPPSASARAGRTSVRNSSITANARRRWTLFTHVRL